MTAQELLDAYADGERNFAEVDLHGAYLTGIDLGRADLSGANLRGADLFGAILTGADLTAADLTMADLRGAYLTVANLTGADLTGADLRGANLGGANLTDAKLNWKSHELIAEVIRHAAGRNVEKHVFAARVILLSNLCWEQFLVLDDPHLSWVLGVLAGYVQEGDGAPDAVRELITS